MCIWWIWEWQMPLERSFTVAWCGSGSGISSLVDEEGLIDADLDGCPASHFCSWLVSLGRARLPRPSGAY